MILFDLFIVYIGSNCQRKKTTTTFYINIKYCSYAVNLRPIFSTSESSALCKFKPK